MTGGPNCLDYRRGRFTNILRRSTSCASLAAATTKNRSSVPDFREGTRAPGRYRRGQERCRASHHWAGREVGGALTDSERRAARGPLARPCRPYRRRQRICRPCQRDSRPCRGRIGKEGFRHCELADRCRQHRPWRRFTAGGAGPEIIVAMRERHVEAGNTNQVLVGRPRRWR